MKQVQFVDMMSTFESGKKQVTWSIVVDSKVVGKVLIYKNDTDYVNAPCVDVRLENNDLNTRDVITQAVKHTISYAYRNLPYEGLNARYSASDAVGRDIYIALGFAADGDAYVDENNRKWQNVRLVL